MSITNLDLVVYILIYGFEKKNVQKTIYKIGDLIYLEHKGSTGQTEELGTAEILEIKGEYIKLGKFIASETLTKGLCLRRDYV